MTSAEIEMRRPNLQIDLAKVPDPRRETKDTRHKRGYSEDGAVRVAAWGRRRGGLAAIGSNRERGFWEVLDWSFSGLDSNMALPDELVD